MSLSVVIPAYHEAENLELLLPKITTTLNQLNAPFEVFVVDGQKEEDNSREICLENNVNYINRAESDSYGAAVRSGINNVQYDKVLFMDADGSHEPKYIEELFPFKDEYDLVIASRYIEGGYTENGKLLVLMSKFLNVFYALLFGLKVKDISNSFKIYDTKQIKALELSCQNFDIIEEILIKMSLNNKTLKIKEVPITFKKRIHGESKRSFASFLYSYLTTLVKLLKYKFFFNKKKK